MIYANAVSGAYQTAPHINFTRPELEQIFYSYRGWTDASSAHAGWLVISPHLQSYFSELVIDPRFTSYTASVSASWIAAGLFCRPGESLTYSPFTAKRIEDAKSARRSIDEFGTLSDNWDGYGASCISDQACGNARRFIDMIEAAPGALPIPDVSPMPSGTISFEWENHGTEAYLEIGNTRYSGFIKSDRQDRIFIHGRTDYLDQQIIGVIQRAITAPHIPSAPVTEIHTQALQYESVAP